MSHWNLLTRRVFLSVHEQDVFQMHIGQHIIIIIIAGAEASAAVYTQVEIFFHHVVRYKRKDQMGRVQRNEEADV